jgi:hypothetical protein
LLDVRALLKANRFPHGMRRFIHLAKAVLASSLAGLVLMVAAIAACPELHELIHHDADKPGHECAAMLFVHGQVDLPVVEAAAIIPVGPVQCLPLNFAAVFSARPETLPPGRGPPVFSLDSQVRPGLR